ncbi:MAG: TIGR02281 family clan AA aspartic protease [Sphingomonadales bacterium]|jgi:aspartyl protease family protein|nr:TIGR02281 family clan AA aspartic protease [Sphingomonadales bacterium]MBK9005014.1 TIGR02281 family clan AA aspartic protease [Sphingomonadales bacterium]MBK9267253.1 TIGR02281 family clan AA aspartic protease [Sphingomonadales bacterium]MBP6433581.1 TIGR02281 family clan AA aspartic protease [Sphingorhabdus sp.]
MDSKLLLPLFAIAIAVGWFFPGGETVAGKAGGSASASVASAPAQNDGSFDPVTLDRREDGHFYATADIGGTPVTFLVDTGASMVALTGNDARALGLSWSNGDLQHVGRGVNGDVFGKPVMLENVAIGDVELGSVRAVIIPNGLDISLLGQSFLERIDNVRIEGGRMTLG